MCRPHALGVRLELFLRPCVTTHVCESVKFFCRHTPFGVCRLRNCISLSFVFFGLVDVTCPSHVMNPRWWFCVCVPSCFQSVPSCGTSPCSQGIDLSLPVQNMPENVVSRMRSPALLYYVVATLLTSSRFRRWKIRHFLARVFEKKMHGDSNPLPSISSSYCFCSTTWTTETWRYRCTMLHPGGMEQFVPLHSPCEYAHTTVPEIGVPQENTLYVGVCLSGDQLLPGRVSGGWYSAVHARILGACVLYSLLHSVTALCWLILNVRPHFGTILSAELQLRESDRHAGAERRLISDCEGQLQGYTPRVSCSPQRRSAQHLVGQEIYRKYVHLG